MSIIHKTITFLTSLLIPCGVTLLLLSCNNGGSSRINNFTPVLVESPLINTGYNDNGNAVNVPYVTLTICKPGTNLCVTLDHILLDTGSTGLRVVSTLVNQLNLPTLSINNIQINECLTFGTGYTWGPVAYADVKIGGEVAQNIPINLIGGSMVPVPSSCSDYAIPPYESTVMSFGSNGIIGLNPQVVDLAASALPTPLPTKGAGYYSCQNNESCNYIILPDNLQVVNPVANFSQDNNGIILQLPQVKTPAANSVIGNLIFGINTQQNNQLPENAPIFEATDTNVTALIGTYYNNQQLAALFDSGTQAYLIPDQINNLCGGGEAYTGLLCPPQPLNLNALITSYPNGNAESYNFTITNALDWITQYPTSAVFPNEGFSIAYVNSLVIWGLPFFYGKNIFLGYVGKTVKNIKTPFSSYTTYNY